MSLDAAARTTATRETARHLLLARRLLLAAEVAEDGFGVIRDAARRHGWQAVDPSPSRETLRFLADAGTVGLDFCIPAAGSPIIGAFLTAYPTTAPGHHRPCSVAFHADGSWRFQAGYRDLWGQSVLPTDQQLHQAWEWDHDAPPKVAAGSGLPASTDFLDALTLALDAAVILAVDDAVSSWDAATARDVARSHGWTATEPERSAGQCCTDFRFRSGDWQLYLSVYEDAGRATVTPSATSEFRARFQAQPPTEELLDRQQMERCWEFHVCHRFIWVSGPPTHHDIDRFLGGSPLAKRLADALALAHAMVHYSTKTPEPQGKNPGRTEY